MSKNLVSFITPRVDNQCFNFVTFDLGTGKEVPHYVQEVHNLLNFFEKPPTFVKTSVKGIVCNIYGFRKNGLIDHEFCEKLATKLKNLKIPFRFMSNLHITAMCAFFAAKIDPENDIQVVQIYVTGEIFKILILFRSTDGYMMIDVREIPKTYDPEILLCGLEPSKIIISNAEFPFPSAKVLALKNALSEWNPIILHNHCAQYLFDAVKTIVGHMFGSEKSKEFFVINQSLDYFGVTAVGKNTSKDDILIVVKGNEYLPATESFTVPRFHKKYYITSKPSSRSPYTILQPPHEITKDGHQIKLSLSVDVNNYPTLTHESVLLSKIKNMPKRLKIEKTEKLPIIGFFDNASVICLWNEKENCYKFLDSWNGKFGKDLFLDFMYPKATLIDSSTEVKSLSGAVYDLIKIMSMPTDDIKMDKNWKFSFTKNDENPVLLEFDTFEKTRKAASPAFLMAMILREHNKAIKAEIGEKPKKLGIRLLDDFENPEARKRVEAALEEACGMIKIGFLFV